MLSIAGVVLSGFYWLGLDTCSEDNERHVKQYLIQGQLVADSEVAKEKDLAEISNGALCKVKDEAMSDGLSFILYRVEAENADYIRLVNGLDGSSKLYGPFYQ
ncbi:hypothetical protein QWY20_09680 [Alkalimonas sp. MEB108]|uniref:Uncharacterized protein n=1 Tax=Alkalimonas cellulosilytica TaxID=3058395 RepID=A0ABU7J5K1_9GAMM|nr:hypothetical protein [Alkalimonas sp. MEB108]MEE2001722.1 hypothetical protein [Alkalimonas sp. MEB108]